ncbi:MAG: 16S rRNA (uracil(1498)-N(3))-methyltransferase [Candidatus Methylacidiphilales bacterium]
MQLFYYPDLVNSNFIELPEDESKHCIRVLRKKIGDEIFLIDGIGNQALCKITIDNPKKCQLQVFNIQHYKNQLVGLHLVIAPTKNFDRMDWMLEKCTEIGVTEITFIETENSERNKVNRERCEKILIQSIKQSKQYWLPKLNDLVLFKHFLNNNNLTDFNCMMAWCNENKTTINQAFIEQKPTLILIGPEGDFTAEEAELAAQKNFKSITLGSNILRTETAAVYACAVINNLNSK